MTYLAVLLTSSHEKGKFSCGKTTLDIYLQKQARQDVKAKVSASFVHSHDGKEVKGYYTLSNGSIPRSPLTETIIKRLPRYKDMPVTVLGRLAVDSRFQGQKNGELLLLDAYDEAMTQVQALARWQSSSIRSTRKPRIFMLSMDL